MEFSEIDEIEQIIEYAKSYRKPGAEFAVYERVHKNTPPLMDCPIIDES
jgi:hypothetical protein